ncbi:MAG: LolA family protein, partial [Haloechinothrix sp.]
MEQTAAPRWRDLVMAMQTAAPPAFTATWVCRDPATGDDSEGTMWFRPPGSLRVECADGTVRHLRDERYFYFVRPDGTAQRAPREKTYAVIEGVDQLLFPGRTYWVDGGFDPPAAEPREVELAGRRGWEVRLAPSRPGQAELTMIVDDAWGILLRVAAPDAGTLYELRDITETPGVDDNRFVWEGALDTSEEEWIARRQQLQRWGASIAPPVPRYWPHGVLADLRDGDPATGAATYVLELPGWPVLDRRPLG